ncbi:MAG: ATP-binding cassette domain-containing protein [Bacteroidia bacterium]|nr:ATP-binding cassette domain-containing protein [Bacteroidia bacterium]MCO5253082.1 ATP-binding cassette domain-containing protein [Bacteroidota bacterium]
MAIRVENITKIYGVQKAVDSISFDIPRGQIVGFLGPNGAGKSTTMKILTGFIPSTSGKAYIDNIDIEEKPLLTRSKIGYLPEHNPLYLDMYIREYLRFMAEINGVKNPSKRTEELIELTGLTIERKKKIGQLSKGYRQRVGLAQALIHNPDVLILDEPTSGLDPNQIGEIRKLILDIGSEKTILLSTHIMQEVEALCQRTIIINRGKIVADAPTSELGKKLESDTVIYVEFSKDIADSELRSIKEIKKVSKGTQPHSWHISTVEPQACKIALNRIIANAEGYILEQKEEKQTLEDIFQKLTQNVDDL